MKIFPIIIASIFTANLATFAQSNLAPRDLEGLKIKFSYGDDSSVIEFSRNQAYEMDDESGTNREFAGDYDADTEGDTVTVTFYGQDGANDVYTLNFTTDATGN